jgi:hypothetical protein
MRCINWFLLTALILGSLLLPACANESERAEKIEPAKIEPIEGTEFKRVILTEKAAQRIDVQTVEARGTTLPYAAVIYDTKGNTWVYTSPSPLTFVRQAIEISRIDGDTAILSKGLPPGTLVVIVGVSELYGAETGVSK